MMKNAMLLPVLCVAVLTQCDIWNKPLVDPLKEKVDELTSIKSIVVTRYPKKNTFQEGFDVDRIPKNAEEWSGDDYGLEVSGINGMDETRVLVPGLEYKVDETAPDDDDDKSSYPFILTVTLVLIDTHRYGRMATEFKISILPPDVKNYTIVAYDDGKNSVVAVPSGFTSMDDGKEVPVAVYVYPAEDWALKSGTFPKYGFDRSPPADHNDYRDIYGPPFTFTIYGGLIDNIKNDNSIYLWADFIEPVLMLTDSTGGIRYYEGVDALSTAIEDAADGGTITVMQNIQAGSETIEITDKSITLQAYDKAAGSVTVSRVGTDSLFTIHSGGTLILTGAGETRRLVIDGAYVKDTDHWKASAALITVNDGLLDMRDGVTLQNNYNEAGTGGAVHVAGGAFTMRGGRITGNSSIKDGDPEYGGGGVYVSSGVFTMSGGMIDGNTGKPFGGGLLISGGDFDFTSGEISGNKAESLSNPTWGGGGGIHVRSGTLTMSGNALIGSNSVPNGGGGGVAVSGDGYFEIKGGEIRGNSTNHSWIAGGGVMLYDENSSATPSFSMSGGLITGNTSYKFDSDDRLLFGDGVFLHDGTFSMSGGALITQDNDVRLELGKSIIIDEYLAVGTQSVALISLPDYVLGRDVLTGGSASAAGTRFSLTEPGWSIVDGKLTNPASSSGGVISTVVDDVYGVRYQVHTFKDSGDFVSAYTGRASILLVGGGGGGGSAGGGGAGGFLEIDTVLLSIGSYALTVGTGGAGSRGAGSNGGDSSFGGSYTAYGGGGGGGGVYNIDGKPGSGTTSFASKMGSGGGGRGSFGESFPAGVGGTGSTNGGAGTVGAMGSSGGGGGAGGDGRDATDTSGGKGGSGTVSTISGGSVTYATGGTGSVKNPSAAQANTGNGGDGVFLYSGTDGGSGIVIIRFPIQ